MGTSVGWFIVMALMGVLGGWLGVKVGRGPVWHGRLAVTVSVLLLVTWAFLVRRPVVALQLIPLPMLSRIEGVGAIPIFMVVVGVAWSRGQMGRQKRLAAWAAVLGLVYFIQGGMWMLESTPAVGFAQTVDGQPVRQSQDYTCVAAASATALNMLHIYTTEAEMAELTETRPVVGTTTVRALYGLSRRLASTPYHAELIEVDFDDLVGMPMPALTPLQYEPTRRHMVTLLTVRPYLIMLHDPVQGHMIMPPDMFKAYYRGQIIVFMPR